MSFKLSVNQFRRKVMRKLTRSIGRESQKQYQQSINREDVKRVLVSRPNSRLGNQLLITPLLQEITNDFPNCKIDLFVRGNIAPILLENYDNVDRIIKLPSKPFKELGKYLNVWIKLRKYKYDIVINVDKASSSGRLSTQLAHARFKFLAHGGSAFKTKHSDYCHMAKAPVYDLRHSLERLGYEIDENTPIPPMDIKLSNEEIAKGKEILEGIVPDPTKKTIYIYTFATGAKCYSKEWWYELYDKLKNKYERDYNIIEILPKENVSQIDFQAPSYYSNDLREMAGVFTHTVAFITGDCGIMHLASACSIPTVGLFSSGNAYIYAPYNDGSIAIETRTTDTDGIVEKIDKILDQKSVRGRI